MIDMVMRVGGLATGMDIESMVNKLMDAERMPLTRMEQDRTTLEWKRDAFRDINRALLELDDMAFDMKMSDAYQTKKVTSSQESAVTATGKTSSSNGSYSIQVESLATSAINVSYGTVDQEIDSEYHGKTFEFFTFDEEGNEQTHTFEVNEGDTVNDVLKRITDNSENNVRAFYDAQANKVVLETTRTGNYNSTEKFNGAEIGFYEEDDGDKKKNTFFTDVLKISTFLKNEDGELINENGDPIVGNEEPLKAEQGGTNAKFTYNNGLEIESKNNWYELNGITFEFHNTTEGNARINVTNDIDHSFNKIMDFVNKYNEVIDKLNGSQQEQIYRDYQPLTDEQKEEMSDDQIKMWEERAKSGILRRETSITAGMFDMRQSWYAQVETGGAYESLTQIGIETTSTYLDGGKLEVNEDDLRTALRENPGDVQRLLTNSAEGNSRGLINRLEDAVESTMKKIEERAGKGSFTLDQYTLGKRMKDLNDRISAFEDRMIRVENRYWSEFTAMEKAIQRMNDQSAQLFSQFGG